VAGEEEGLTDAAVVERLRAAGCVFADEEARLLTGAATSPAELAAMVDRRAAGLPLEHVLGFAEFCGLRVAVGPGVFVPRRRTEFLVSEAVSRAAEAAARAGAGPLSTLVDLCCGCGAVGAAVAARLGDVELHAVDIDPVAATYARRNLGRDDRAHVYQGDLYTPLPAGLRGRVAVVTANVPYVPSPEVGLLPAEARLHEPLSAVDGGPDGLDVARRVAAGAPGWLAPGGHVLVETSQRQAPLAAEAFASAGLIPRISSCEELNATVVTGTRPATPA
jgi:release factor glutamine methyltransferase